jgi:hypothetical protein
MPTDSKVVVLSFTSDVAIGGLPSSTLSDTDMKAIELASAKTMKVDPSLVSMLSYRATANARVRRNLVEEASDKLVREAAVSVIKLSALKTNGPFQKTIFKTPKVLKTARKMTKMLTQGKVPAHNMPSSTEINSNEKVAQSTPIAAQAQIKTKKSSQSHETPIAPAAVTYSITATIQTKMIVAEAEATSFYNALVASLADTSKFSTELQAAAQSTGSTNMGSATVTGVTTSTMSTTSTSDESEDESGLASGAIIGIAIGVVITW